METKPLTEAEIDEYIELLWKHSPSFQDAEKRLSCLLKEKMELLAVLSHEAPLPEDVLEGMLLELETYTETKAKMATILSLWSSVMVSGIPVDKINSPSMIQCIRASTALLKKINGKPLTF